MLTTVININSCTKPFCIKIKIFLYRNTRQFIVIGVVPHLNFISLSFNLRFHSMYTNGKAYMNQMKNKIIK